jgi:hypothetical protein
MQVVFRLCTMLPDEVGLRCTYGQSLFATVDGWRFVVIENSLRHTLPIGTTGINLPCNSVSTVTHKIGNPFSRICKADAGKK